MTAEQFGEKEGTWRGDDWALRWSKAGGQRKPSGASEPDSLDCLLPKLKTGAGWVGWKLGKRIYN